jgi:hypothetical protein
VSAWLNNASLYGEQYIILDGNARPGETEARQKRIAGYVKVGIGEDD